MIRLAAVLTRKRSTLKRENLELGLLVRERLVREATAVALRDLGYLEIGQS